MQALQAQPIQQVAPEMPPEVWQAINEPRRDANTASLPQAGGPADARSITPTIVDPQVAPTIHVSESARDSELTDSPIPQSDLAGINSMLDALQAKRLAKPDRLQQGAVPATDRQDDPFAPKLAIGTQSDSDRSFGNPPGETAHSDPRFNQQNFQKLLQSIAINTCIVMCVGVGFILIAKQWFFKQAKPTAKTSENTIQITSTLRLSPKSNLFLVAAGTHRLIVASDQNGINSVVPLTDSFASTLDSLADVAQETKAADRRDAGGESLAGLYSLASLGQATSDKITKSKTADGENADEIRRKMEAALNEHGLKELFVQTMRSQS